MKKKSWRELKKKKKKKTSTDWCDIDMMIVKNVIERIAKPQTHIFDLSFQSRTCNPPKNEGNTSDTPV